MRKLGIDYLPHLRTVRSSWRIDHARSEEGDSMKNLLLKFVEAGDASGWNEMRYGRTRRWLDIGPVSLVGKTLAGFDLTWCDLSGSDLEGADLRKSWFSHSDLTGANLSNVIATDACFDYMRVDDANLSGADFSRSSLAGVRFHGADLNRTNFTGATLEEPKYGSLERAKNVSTAIFADVKYDRI